MKRISILVCAVTLLLSACQIKGDIEVHDAWMRATAQGENGAVYFMIHNHSAENDELIGATSNVTDFVEIHESAMIDDVMQMKMLSSVPLNADSDVVFAPGKLHIMLVNIRQDLKVGDHIGIILHFKNHEDMIVNVSVEETAPTGDEHTH